MRSDGGFAVFDVGAFEEGVDLLSHDLVKESVGQMRMEHAAELERDLPRKHGRS